MKYIRDRGMKATKIFATLMALGVVASGIFGMTQAGKYLVDKTLYTVGLYTVSPYNRHMSDHMSSNTGLRASCDNKLSILLADHIASVCREFLGLHPPCTPPCTPPHPLPLLPGGLPSPYRMLLICWLSYAQWLAHNFQRDFANRCWQVQFTWLVFTCLTWSLVAVACCTSVVYRSWSCSILTYL